MGHVILGPVETVLISLSKEVALLLMVDDVLVRGGFELRLIVPHGIKITIKDTVTAALVVIEGLIHVSLILVLESFPVRIVGFVDIVQRLALQFLGTVKAILGISLQAILKLFLFLGLCRDIPLLHGGAGAVMALVVAVSKMYGRTHVAVVLFC